MSTTIGRRQFLRGAGAGGLAVVVGPTLWQQTAAAAAPPVEQLHLQFGANAATQVSVSWATATKVSRPRVRYGTAQGGLGSVVDAVTKTYQDPKTRRVVVTHHASLTGLQPSTDYVYGALHDGATPLLGTLLTGPAGRAPFRFTSFGDQGVNGLADGSVASNVVVDNIEAAQPLLHLVNGDLAYSDIQTDPAGAWDAWFNQNQRSTRHRPWMAAAGNHEQLTGNGPIGYDAYLTRYANPPNGVTGLNGYFYSFVVGSVCFVVLQNDDVAYQWTTDNYVHGYSGGAQKEWLQKTLAAADADPAIDWIVVSMHQIAMSSSTIGNGSDLGIRQEWLPLFDRYHVDLVLGGHDHDYERTYTVKGVIPESPTLTPRVVDDATEHIDATKGAVHLVLGGGGARPLNTYAPDMAPPRSKVTVAKGQYVAGIVEYEVPTWSAVTNPEDPYGFGVFDVVPAAPDGKTQIRASYYVTGTTPMLYDQFILEKPRSA